MENSIVRNNLMNEKGYTPYCGDDNCRKRMPRTKVVTNCTTCAFTDSKYTEETCNKCSRDFDKYEPK